MERVAEELVDVCRNLYQNGMQKSSGGNVSGRVGENKMLIKASGGSFRDMDRDGLILTDFKGRFISGKGTPTRESFLHGCIYSFSQQTNAVVHVHAPYATALSACMNELELVTWQAKLKLSVPIPVLNVDAPVVQERHQKMLCQILADNSVKGFVLKNHGIVAMGKGITEAWNTVELIEETAHIAFLMHLL